jgi:ribokinase
MIVVFGSINVDLVFALTSLPQPGETVLGQDYRVVAGGKGANQAVAAARDGGRVAMVGQIGDDGFAAVARASLAEAGVDLAGVGVSRRPTGCAAICVDSAGRNQIAVASGANGDVRAAQVSDKLLGTDTTLVLQMEVPPAENAALIARARARDCRIILNLAPATKLDRAALSAVDVLVVNDGEGAWLAASLGIEAGEPAAMARALAAWLNVTVVMTLGEKGVIAATGDATWSVGALPVTPVDTTAAGDCFVGVLAAALDRGDGLGVALHRASVAAGLACTVEGAQPSLPPANVIDKKLGALAPARTL